MAKDAASKDDYLKMEDERSRIDAHNVAQHRSEELSKYFHQKASARVGKVGMAVIGIVAFFTVCMFFLLLFSYTPNGKSFLGHLIFYIY